MENMSSETISQSILLCGSVKVVDVTGSVIEDIEGSLHAGFTFTIFDSEVKICVFKKWLVHKNI